MREANDNGPKRASRPFTEPPSGLDPLLNLHDVRAATRLGSSTIYRGIAAGTFPRPVRLGPGTVRWRTSVVRSWLEKLEAA